MPSDVRQALHIAPGDEVEFEVVADGQVVMHGLKMIPAEQAWFWTESWQRGERDATADIAAGRTEVFKDNESFLDFIASAAEGD